MPLDPESEAVLEYLKAKPSTSLTTPDVDLERAVRGMFGDVRLRRALSPLEKLMLPPTRPFTHSDVEAARSHAGWWDEFGFSIEEVRTWLRAGLEPNEAYLAALLIQEGITPERLSQQLTHPSTGERLTILDLARSVRCENVFDSTTTLCSVFDAAGIERKRGAAVLPRWLRRRNDRNRHAG